MLSDILVKKFIKNNENIKDPKVRDSYGTVGGIVGVCVNFLLFLIKLFVGLAAASISVTADAFNNLLDAASSIITIVGFKMASKPSDKEHPFGHGRIEYISGLVVAFMVTLVGIQFIKSSWEKIRNPEAVKFEVIPFVLLLISIALKVWLSHFNKFIGNKIDSSALKAASVDALGDVFTSSCVAVSFLAAKFTSFPVDGYMGMAVALFIVYSGYGLIKDTLNPILGCAPDPELLNAIQTKVLSYPHVRGVHDLVIHNYGPGRSFSSIHAEFPSNMSLVQTHEIVDKAEREISDEYNTNLVIHVDPVVDLNGEDKKLQEYVMETLDTLEYVKSYHDFRVVKDAKNKVFLFDVVVDTAAENIPKDMDIRNYLDQHISEKFSDYKLVITIDRNYSLTH